MKKGNGSIIVGIERNARGCIHGKARLDEVFTGDVEEMRLLSEKGDFGCMIYAGILEHLVDRWSAFKDRTDLSFLRKSKRHV